MSNHPLIPPFVLHSLIAWLLFTLLVGQAYAHERLVRKVRPKLCTFVHRLLHATSLALIAIDCGLLLFFAAQAARAAVLA